MTRCKCINVGSIEINSIFFGVSYRHTRCGSRVRSVMNFIEKQYLFCQCIGFTPLACYFYRKGFHFLSLSFRSYLFSVFCGDAHFSLSLFHFYLSSHTRCVCTVLVCTRTLEPD